MYGAVNIPAIWERRLETVIQDLDNVINFFDDILVFAEYFDGMIVALDAVLERLKEHGLRLIVINAPLQQHLSNFWATRSTLRVFTNQTNILKQYAMLQSHHPLMNNSYLSVKQLIIILLFQNKLP